MLLQSSSDVIHVLPAWKKDWNVSFKLPTAGSGIVTCEYENGAITKLEHQNKDAGKKLILHQNCIY